MYNYVDFGAQIEAFKRDLYGNLGNRRSPITKFLQCHEDTNGEWVPDQEEGDLELVVS